MCPVRFPFANLGSSHRLLTVRAVSVFFSFPDFTFHICLLSLVSSLLTFFSLPLFRLSYSSLFPERRHNYPLGRIDCRLGHWPLSHCTYRPSSFLAVHSTKKKCSCTVYSVHISLRHRKTVSGSGQRDKQANRDTGTRTSLLITSRRR